MEALLQTFQSYTNIFLMAIFDSTHNNRMICIDYQLTNFQHQQSAVSM